MTAQSRVLAMFVPDSDAEAVEFEARLDAYRSEVLAAATEVARGQYLTDSTGTPEDKAYNQAVSDVLAAIGALLEGGAA